MTGELPDDFADALAAFTREVETAQANLLEEMRGEIRRLEADLADARTSVAALDERLRALEEGAAAAPAGPGAAEEAGLNDEARERMRWRHPEVWKLSQAGFTPEAIAERSEKTLGEIRLILHMMGASGPTGRQTAKEE